MLKKGLFFLVVLLMSLTSMGQMSKKEAKEKMKKADGLFRQLRYGDALGYYEELNEFAPKEEEYVYRIGICKIHIDGEQEKGLDYLLSIRKRSDYPEYDFYLAQAYYYNYNFPEAIKLYKQFQKTVDDENYHLKQYVQLMMSYCINAYEIMQDTMNAKIISLGEPLNSKHHEYTPAVTPEESMLVFTYRGSRSKGGLLNPKLKPTVKNGRYYEDVFTSYKGKDGKWVKPYPIDSINTLGNDAAVALSPTGDKLVIFKSSSSNPGDLYVSYFKDSTWSTPKAFEGDVNSPDWEGSAAFTTDGSKLYFSSERLGGYGGKDIYVAELQKDGTWSNVHNLGPEINSEHDEDAPYVHPDRKTLYFSSNGTRSMGGYDIFYATLTPDNKWKNVINAGYPINSLDDDRYYVLSADGQTGYFSRESETGNSDQDLYIITPGKVGDPPVLALITGSVFLNGGNEQGEIFVYDLETGEL